MNGPHSFSSSYNLPSSLYFFLVLKPNPITMNKQRILTPAIHIFCKLIEIAMPISDTAANIEKSTKIHFIFAIMYPPILIKNDSFPNRLSPQLRMLPLLNFTYQFNKSQWV